MNTDRSTWKKTERVPSLRSFPSRPPARIASVALSLVWLAPGVLVVLAPTPRLLGAFKTPSLRGVGFTLPYGHGGSFWGLTSVLDAHRTGGLPADRPYAVGDLDPFLPAFDQASIPLLVAFLDSLRLDVTP